MSLVSRGDIGTGGDDTKQLIVAIQNDRLVDWLDGAAVESSSEPVRAAEAATENIAALSARVGAEMVGALKANGIEASALNPPMRQQRPELTVELEGSDIAAAVAVVAALGYRPIEELSAGALESYRRVQGELPLAVAGGDGAHVTLRWRTGRLGRVPRLLRPNMADWDFVSLPSSLWPLYHPIRLLRPLRSRLGWRSPRQSLGPHIPTPLSLVQPLLAQAGIDDGDLLVDVGCGDGRVLIEAARSIGCRCLGVDMDGPLIETARRAASAAGVDDLVSFECADLRQCDVSAATAAFVFLPVSALGEVVDHLADSMGRGSVILAHEHHPIPSVRDPDALTPVFSATALTVAHMWRV